VTAPSSTILLVDDSPMNLQVLTRTLHGSGHRILAAKDGQAALQIARQARPDLMLLDVMMPGMDGFEVCRAIKAHPDTRDIVVIFLSALGEVSDKVSGLSLGAVDYITKPIQADEVLARVATHLTRQYLERELRVSRDRLDRELVSAGRMQRLILPTALPVHPAVRFAAHYQTSRHAGGDYYDVLTLGPDRFAIIVTDVSGHGAPAAIVMAMIRAVVHTYPGVADDPPAVLRYLNQHFSYLWNSGMFATAVYGVLDPSQHLLRLSCAGHPPPLLVRDGREAEPMRVYAVMPLLLEDLRDIPCLDLELRAGDRLAFYTDGVTDRLTTDGSMYDLARLTSALSGVGPLDPAAGIAKVVADLDTFAAGREPEDDQTLLLVAIDR
jgi:sigma-B regulation protein RsbU (phosphoserine phosphatase)